MRNDSKIAICNDPSMSVMQREAKSHFFSSTNLGAHLQSHHPDHYNEFVKRNYFKKSVCSSFSHECECYYNDFMMMQLHVYRHLAKMSIK